MATDYNQHPTPGPDDELLHSPFVDQHGRLTSPFSPYTPLCTNFDATQQGNNSINGMQDNNDVDGTQHHSDIHSDSSMGSSDSDSDAEEDEDKDDLSDKENVSTSGTVDKGEKLDLQSNSRTMATLLELSEAMRYLTHNHVAREQKVLIRLTYGEVVVRYEALGTQIPSEPQPSSADTMAYIVKLAKCMRYLSREQLSNNEKVIIEYNNDFMSIVYDGTSRERRGGERVWMSEFIQGPPVQGGGLARTQFREMLSPLNNVFWICVQREMEEGGWDSGVRGLDLQRGEPYLGRAYTNDEIASGRGLLELGM